MNLLSLSKKSKWSIAIIFALLKINNLQVTENRKMTRFKVFRQARYISIISAASKIDAIWFLYIESACMTSIDNLQSPNIHCLNISSQLLLILLSAEIGSVRQHGENDPYKLMCSRKNSLFE
jgi:hypothetical protein